MAKTVEQNKCKQYSIKIIQPIVSFEMNAWNLDRHHETTLHRLRLGICKHSNSYLHKIGKHPDGLCETCNCYDNVKHTLIYCQKYNIQRQELHQKCNKLNIKLNLNNLLGKNSQLTDDIFTFFRKCNIQP